MAGTHTIIARGRLVKAFPIDVFDKGVNAFFNAMDEGIKAIGRGDANAVERALATMQRHKGLSVKMMGIAAMFRKALDNGIENADASKFRQAGRVLLEDMLRTYDAFGGRGTALKRDFERRVKTMNIARRIRLTARLCNAMAKPLHPKLADLRTMKSVVNFLLKQVGQVAKGFFRDNSWEGVRKVEDAIADLGVDLTFQGTEERDYRVDGGSKGYKYTLTWTNAYRDEFTVDCILVCCAAGTVQDPWDKYDMIFYPTRERVKKNSISKMLDDKNW